jgi:S-DNA-T family DNA segregation ATPase FtsK/SpoIIIE
MKLPVIVTIVDGYDPVRGHALEEPIETVLNQLLRDGASVGMYLVITGLRGDSIKISMTSNIPTRMGLFLVEDNAIKDIVGRDALISQEIPGRGQIKEDEVVAFQFYLATKGDSDLKRLSHMEKEVENIKQAWTGKRPRPIPMLPKVLTLAEFYGSRDVQQALDDSKLPLGRSMETTEVISYDPKKQSYFLIADQEPSQTEYLERIILQNIKALSGQFAFVLFDAQERFTNHYSAFDLVIKAGEYSDTIVNIRNDLASREVTGGAGQLPTLYYMPDVLDFVSQSMLDEASVKKLLRQCGEAGVYFIFQGDRNKIENSYDEVVKVIRSNAPAGMIGSRMNDQGLIKVKSNFNEPIVDPDQHHFYVGREAVRIKLPRES